MPEQMITAYRTPDELSSCIDSLEHKLCCKHYFSKAKRKEDETVLHLLRRMKEYEKAPALRTLTNDDFILAQYDIIRIVNDTKTLTVINTDYGDRSNFIYTLEDCLQAAIKMMIPEIVDERLMHFLVIASNPRQGIILEYGNHGPKFEQVGVTCGYA